MSRKPKPSLRTYERKVDEHAAITPVEYGGLQAAFEHFSSALFDGALPDVFIAYQRKANSMGHFAPDRYSGQTRKFNKSELVLNPDAFINQTDEQICQTLVHEMTHVWQHAHGKPSARGYHNKEWAAKMKAIGLQPSNTGMVGGKETGQRMSDYIIPDGPFTKVFAKLAATGWKLNLQSAHRAGRKGGTNDSKTTFICASCDAQIYGKPSTDMICGPCAAAALVELMGAAAAPVIELLTRYKAQAVVKSAPVLDPPTPVLSYDQQPAATAG